MPMAHLPVLVDFWCYADDPTHTLGEIWMSLVQDYTGIATISPNMICQTLNGGSTLTYTRHETEQKIMLKYDHTIRP